MKIAIRGTVIDTQDIYEVTPVVGDERLKAMYFQSKENYKKAIEVDSGYLFKIMLFNSKEITFYVHCSDLANNVRWHDDNPCNYHHYTKEAKRIAEQARDWVITLWGADPSKIPSIDIISESEGVQPNLHIKNFNDKKKDDEGKPDKNPEPTGAEKVLNWFEMRQTNHGSTPTPFEIKKYLQRIIEEEKNKP